MATTTPKLKVGDTVLFLSHFAEGPIYGTQSHRTVPAVVVGIEANGAPSLQVLNYGVVGLSFVRAAEYDASGSRPGTWRPRA